jgi:hypothetical protein
MLLDQLSDQYRLNLAVLDVAEQVEQVSGKEIDFRPTPKLRVRAQSSMARQKMARHVIQFNPKDRPHLSHILAHECARLLRMLATSPEERRVPASTPKTLGVARNEIREEAQFLPEDLRGEMIDMWIHGLITQVTSQPVDVRIEEWIADNYPGLRQEQRRSLRTETRTVTANMSPDVRRTAAASVFRRANALNYAYLDHIGDILERSFESTFEGNPEIVALGRSLSEILDDETASDRELVDRCAEAIEVRNWFVWLDFEDMPISYYADLT